MGEPIIYFLSTKKPTHNKTQISSEKCHFYSRKNPRLTVVARLCNAIDFQTPFSETDEVNRCERFPLTACARTFRNKETIHYNTMNCRAKVGGPDSGSAWYF